MLPGWESPTSGSLSLKLRTTEEDGLLMFNSGHIGEVGSAIITTSAIITAVTCYVLILALEF